jgi:hypothetical protein
LPSALLLLRHCLPSSNLFAFQRDSYVCRGISKVCKWQREHLNKGRKTDLNGPHGGKTLKPIAQESIEALGLREPLDGTKALAYMRKFRVMPYWNEARGLFFRPHIGTDARQRFQEVLHLCGEEDVQRVRHELRQGFNPLQGEISTECNQANLKEDEIQKDIEKKTKTRKRTRGPYRKSAPLPSSFR